MARPKPNYNWIGSTLGNRYVITEFIDQGGMSAVYKANDPNLRRTVAIKLIHHHLSRDSRFIRRFEQEAAAVAKLRHPNIVTVYDFNHDEDNYYMVMEYVPGQTLKQKLKDLSAKNERLPLAETIRLMISICEAVAFAHEYEMIHRDLKPANVMLTPNGQTILMDFGVVKMVGEQDLTATGATIGTAKYMSPEQARGEPSDERSDIYALGVILYEMLAGRPPFEADTTIGILMKHVGEPVPDIRQIQKDIPSELATIIEKALAKNPGDRYQSAVHMAAALRLLTRLDQASAPMTDSQATVSSKKRDRLPTEPASDPSRVRPARSPRPTVASGEAISLSTPSNVKYWIIGLAVVGLLFMTGAAGLLVYFFGPLSSGAQATGNEIAGDLPSSEGMVRIEGAAYSVGLENPDKDHAPPQTVELAEYWIDQHEATNVRYAEFLATADQSPPPGWPDGNIPADQDDFPVVGVTWGQARAFCEWANKRLPTEAEWEIAARGATGRLYPWGDNQQAVQLPRSGAYPVGTKLTNQSPFGVLDMAGNVWEWVDEPYAPIPDGQRILRGGANDFLKDMAYRLVGDPAIPTMTASAGIRCAADEVNVVTHNHDHEVAEGVFFEDSFVDPGSGWPILSEGAFYYGYHPPDYYHMEVATPDNVAAVSRPPNFDTITVEAEVLVDHTDTEDGNFRYGLLLRRMAEDQFYAFVIAPRLETWYVLKRSPEGLETLAEGSVTGLQGLAPAGITPDTTDKLRVDANGPDFTFHINNNIVTQVSDPTYANGEIGFYVETLDESLAHVHFDALIIRRVEGAAGEVSDAALIEDKFTDPNSGWPAEDIEGEPYRYGYHPPDYYHVEPRAANEHIAVSLEDSYGDVAVETDVFVDHTTTEAGDFRYGLVLRRMAEDQFYAFTISPRQETWHILKRSPQGLETLAEGDVTGLQGLAPPGLTPDGVDTLRVDALGATFAFQVNGQVVEQVSDDSYAEGELGFYVQNLDETLSHIHYESLTIDEVDPDAVAGE